jgi:hypothetical protein
MCSLWQFFLKADKKIGMHNNFFELGGHSLLAMGLATMANPLYHPCSNISVITMMLSTKRWIR